MSSATVQSFVILAIATGAIITVEERGLAPDEMPAILYAKEVGDKAFRKFPEMGNPKKNLAKTYQHCENLRDRLDSAADEYSPLILITISQILLTDLMEKIKDKSKLELLEPLAEAVDGIHDLLDPDWRHIDVYEKADDLVAEIKKEIGFVS